MNAIGSALSRLCVPQPSMGSQHWCLTMLLGGLSSLDISFSEVQAGIEDLDGAFTTVSSFVGPRGCVEAAEAVAYARGRDLRAAEVVRENILVAVSNPCL